MGMTSKDLPEKGDTFSVGSSSVFVRADGRLAGILDILDDTYGWVQVLEVLTTKVISRYPGGIKYAKHIINERYGQ